ncbi:bifunctional hydroxymethylpyrimidine kinase/phosphomethylpyrimidine kinase [Alkalicoccobacillus porphyridii]|uniref:Hydroxymethylpyrimidine/phosphomethylpyrimidine kinase n=1 Tax=Alkalicoccobacillus porphyridii TaxID=2597270 RepID=A0A553ZZD6_9BACI|nr:bifunctional hydroxymethylpyrimidine kinase/phosphomethylpyrimidine kinase [Alkalicoccobacillus porphyridii]TSB46808.1 bifunctional hydroxymethylpyrimidine kinase/phosphomethylpyrimidine kinase [Alkalicoccobacillus porphyridii]
MMTIHTALTIAGTDPTGGAGIQADLKTFQEREVFGMSVITSVLAQNTTGVKKIEHMSLELIEAQLQAVITDISPSAVKTGMIATPAMMELLADYVKDLNVPYICDPVMIAKSGDPLMDEHSRQSMQRTLIPHATIVTPNIPEAQDLTGLTIQSIADMERAAKMIVTEFGAKAAVVKAGYLHEHSTDVLYANNQITHLHAQRTNTIHLHGTGCTFSAAITAELAKGYSLEQAVSTGKSFISDAISYTLELGKGNGPTNHWGYRLKGLPKS